MGALDYQSKHSDAGLWKIVESKENATTRLEKWNSCEKEFEILLTKKELKDLLTLCDQIK